MIQLSANRRRIIRRSFWEGQGVDGRAFPGICNDDGLGDEVRRRIEKFASLLKLAAATWGKPGLPDWRSSLNDSVSAFPGDLQWAVQR
jgi:hypothetical protein